MVSQKELYERVAGDSLDPSVASRNLLSLVDNSLRHADLDGQSNDNDRAIEAARTKWIASVQRHLRALARTGERPATEARISEIELQVSAFDAEDASQRRTAADHRIDEMAAAQHLLDQAASILSAVSGALSIELPPDRDDASTELATIDRQIRAFVESFQEQMRVLVRGAEQQLASTRAEVETGELQQALIGAQEDLVALREELQELGMDGDSYELRRSQLATERERLVEIESEERLLPELEQAAASAWAEIMELGARRRSRRQDLVDKAADQSGSLRFHVSALADYGGWVQRVREILSLRSDAFLEDIPAIAQWMCDTGVPAETRLERFTQWRSALVANTYVDLHRSDVRSTWWQRLQGLEETVRLRLATEYPDDLVSMDFLRDGGDPTSEADWQPVSHGSPGQRSAAMLSFVLHHGAEPLVLDQPEDDLDSAWITDLIIREIRRSRWNRQIIIVTHNANIPVNGDAERVIVMENRDGEIGVKHSEAREHHIGPIEDPIVRKDIQQIMEGGVRAFMQRERRYNNELSTYRAALHGDSIDR